MICNKCGNEVSSNFKFCNRCGNALNHEQANMQDMQRTMILPSMDSTSNYE